MKEINVYLVATLNKQGNPISVSPTSCMRIANVCAQISQFNPHREAGLDIIIGKTVIRVRNNASMLTRVKATYEKFVKGEYRKIKKMKTRGTDII